MEIANEFSLGVPLERAWPLLTDLERVAPAMPGVTVEGSEGDELRATMRVKVGPITVSYRTKVVLASADETTQTAVLKASGRELRGSGTVEATVTAVLRPSGDTADATIVTLTTDLAVTGRVAQFGGGVMREVADRMLRQFAQRLATQLEEPVAPAATSSATSSASAPRPAAPAPAGAPRPAAPEALDLGAVAGTALLPSGPTTAAFLGAFAGTFLGALLAALLLRARR
jgi:carbon monoxide dehydrogenase subunit G